MTAQDILRWALQRTGEPANSTAAALASGTNTTDTITSADAILRFISDGSEELATACFAIIKSGTIAGQATRTADLSAVTVTGSFKLWAALGAQFGSTKLREKDLLILQSEDPLYLMAATGTVSRWYAEGRRSIGLHPAPSVGATLTVYGLAVPPRVTATGDTISWLQTDAEARPLVLYVAIQVGLQNRDNPEIFERVPEMILEYNDLTLARYLALPDDLRMRHYPAPPRKMEAPSVG